MSDRNVITKHVTGAAFSFYTASEIRKLSVKRITSGLAFDPLKQPILNGLYDPSLGPTEKFSTPCPTCGLMNSDCPGHIGHIELVVPTYNPLLFSILVRILHLKCFICHRFRGNPILFRVLLLKLRLLDAGLLVDFLELNDMNVSTKAEKRNAEEESSSILETRFRDFELRMKNKLANLSIAETTSGRDLQIIAKFRNELITSFFKLKGSAQGKCVSCGSYTPKLRKDAHTKIFQLPLADKVQAKMEKLNRSIPDVLNLTTVSLDKRNMAKSNDDSDDEVDGDESDDEMKPDAKFSDTPRLLFPNEIERHIQLLWHEEYEVLSAIFNSADATICPNGLKYRFQDYNTFFIRVLAVPPSRFRPPVVLGDLTFDHPQNNYFKKIIDCNNLLADLDPVKSLDALQQRDLSRASTAWIELQVNVNCLMDSAKNPNPATIKSAPVGIRQQMERKEGLFRMHMMGKRVNHTARSVISPDPYLQTNEIGIPERFAKKLTYPQPVAEWNVEQMRQAVINGPHVYPGANFIQEDNGRLINLEQRSLDQRKALSKTLLTSSISTSNSQISPDISSRTGGKVVLRHLLSGDILLANRQPTLHKPSMMAHKAKILYNQQTIRMHYANCKSYNADFDGDEINLHFPQNELARAELYTIANTDNQYIVPTNGKPLRGLIQDHVGAGVIMSKRDTFFTREEFQQFLYIACFDPKDCAAIVTPVPAIMKPRALWTGKQLISSVISYICGDGTPLSMDGTSAVPADAWYKGCEEGKVIIRDNQLLCGILDKNQYGASAYSLVHSIYEIYGATSAGNMLSSLGRLFTAFFQNRGFTCAMDDLVINKKVDALRMKEINKSEIAGILACAKFAEVDVSNLLSENSNTFNLTAAKTIVSKALKAKLKNRDNYESLDQVMRGALNPTTSKIISQCLPAGQIKPFPQNCMSVMTLSGAKGSLVNFSQISCCLGQQELEGRRVPVMISGKSLPSFAPFDSTPRSGGYVTQRFLSGIKPQEFYFHCMAGREGLVDTAVKTARSGYLQRCLIKHLESLKVSYDYTVRDSDNSVVQFQYGEDALDVTRARYLEKFSFFAKNYRALIHRLNPKKNLSNLDTEEVPKYMALNKKNADPVLSVFTPTRNVGAVSESFTAALNKYIANNPDNLFKSDTNPSSKLTGEKFALLMNMKYLKSVADPGEAVGCIAGQSVGEPSTQMTLNTFHLAGQGGRNVTLGIPRLREIVMTASANISTPAMELKLANSADKNLANFIASKLNRLRLSEVIDFIRVKEVIENDGASRNKVRSYNISMKLLPINDSKYKVSTFNVKMQEIKTAIETSFIPQLMVFIKKEFKRKSTFVKTASLHSLITSQKEKNIRASNGDDEDGTGASFEEDDEADEENNMAANDGDANEAAQKSKKNEGANYDDEEEENNVEMEDIEESGMNKIAESDEESADEESVEDKTAADNVRKLVDKHSFLQNISYNEDKLIVDLKLSLPVQSKKLLIVSAAESISKHVFVRATKGISRSFVEEREKNGVKEYIVSTDGVNFAAALKCDGLKTSNIESNDIAAILNTYGVEAARASIVSQVAAVFEAYGIGVDTRHLLLIADYMTFHGGFRAMNRVGISYNTSPWLKMTFETCMSFMTNAAIYGEVDRINTPASNLVMGKPIGSGTGCFDLLVPLEDK